MANDYKDETSVIGKWLKYCFGLTFLEPNVVGDVYALELWEEMPADPRVEQFSDYLIENYIDENSPFPPSMWAENSASLQRTTNSCESFHSKFNKYCQVTHPNIFYFVNCLKNMQTDIYVTFNSVEKNISRPVQNSMINKLAFLEYKILQYRKKEISTLNFVKCMAYKYASSLI